MKAQSNNPLPTSIVRWKEGEFCYYYNHKDNGKQEEGNEGRRYEAEFVITKSPEKTEIEKALARAILDSEIDQKITGNIEIEGKKAIDIVKTYTVTKEIADKIAAIIIKTPIDFKEAEAIEAEPIKVIIKK